MWLRVDRVVTGAEEFFQENCRLIIENVCIFVYSALIEPRRRDLTVLAPRSKVRREGAYSLDSILTSDRCTE